MFIFKDTGVLPRLSVGLISVRQKGGLPGTPPRNPPPRGPNAWKHFGPELDPGRLPGAFHKAPGQRGNSWLRGAHNPHDLMFWRIRKIK